MEDESLVYYILNIEALEGCKLDHFIAVVVAMNRLRNLYFGLSSEKKPLNLKDLIELLSCVN